MAADHIKLKIATLTAMRKQLTDVKEHVEERIADMEYPGQSVISKDSLRKSLRDIVAQLDALKFAERELTRMYGTPPDVIQGNTAGLT